MKKLAFAVCMLVGLSGAAMAMDMPFTATITGQASGFISPGDVMNNGMVYAGSMNGVDPIFLTRCGYGQIWNPDTDACEGTLSATSSPTANTYCSNIAPPDINSHGYDDWYLPHKTELAFIATKQIDGLSGVYISSDYYTSFNYVPYYHNVNMTTGVSGADGYTHPARCIRVGN